MARIDEFIAFKATMELLKERNLYHIVEEVYKKCKESLDQENPKNHVKEVYAPFTPEEISDKIAQLLKTENISSEIKIIFQSIENLHMACPNDTGDWYFTGDFPTPGGKKVVNKAFINFYEGKKERAY